MISEEGDSSHGYEMGYVILLIISQIDQIDSANFSAYFGT
jgi:hypothetical protein